MFAASKTGAPASPPVYVEDVFSTYLYTGNGSTQTITNGIDLSTKGGLVWIKNRDTSGYSHLLMDTVRGTTKALSSNTTAATRTDIYGLTAFNSTGFSLNFDSEYNQSNKTFVSWTFREQAKFFDVVTYTGNGANRTISHNLGSVPGCFIVKKINGDGRWSVYHRSLGNTKYLQLNATNAEDTVTTFWNSTDPTSTVFSIGTNSIVNASGDDYIVYLFAHDAGGFGLTGTDNVISCGTFTTDGSGNATVSLGYEPQWLLFKKSLSAGDWKLADVMRGFNASGWNELNPNYFSAESVQSGANILIPTATGFSGNNSTFSASATYIYIAIRRGPMKTPTTGTSVFSPLTRTGTGSAATVTGVGFPPDLVIDQIRGDAGNNTTVADRLRGRANYLATNDSAAEQTSSSSTQDITSFNMDGISVGTSWNSAINGSGNTTINWFFRRAPSFFDEVCYAGTGTSGQTFSHNLGVIPELMIVKQRSTGRNWTVYSAPSGATKYQVLNNVLLDQASTGMWNDTTPTSTVFSVGNSFATNESAGTYVAYLFATCLGVSKVGSYTGTGALQTVNCGFAAGARFVLIKRTDDNGDWYVWDVTRGIISGNDPYLLLNSTAAEVTNTDYIDPSATGFEISSTAPAAINANGGTYIFLAIA